MFAIRQVDLGKIMYERKMTVPELSRAAGLSEAGVRKAARAQDGQRFRPRTIFALAKALDVDPSAFASVEG